MSRIPKFENAKTVCQQPHLSLNPMIRPAFNPCFLDTFNDIWYRMFLIKACDKFYTEFMAPVQQAVLFAPKTQVNYTLVSSY